MTNTFAIFSGRTSRAARLAAGCAGPIATRTFLTHGMRAAQKSLADFLPLIDWNNFNRRNLNCEVKISGENCAVFACGDETQAVLWLLRLDITGENGMLQPSTTPRAFEVEVPGLKRGSYRVTAWNTIEGVRVAALQAQSDGQCLRFETPPFATDLALAIGRDGD